jgi:hypothetical protein
LEAERFLPFFTSSSQGEPVPTRTPSPWHTSYRPSLGWPTVNNKESGGQTQKTRASSIKKTIEPRPTSQPTPPTIFLKGKRVGSASHFGHPQSNQFLSPTLTPFFWGMRLTLILQITSTIKLFKTLYPGKIVNNPTLVLR